MLFRSFIGNAGESGLEYELAKNFADYLGVRLQIKTLENNDQLFNELENNNIDIAAANLLFQPQRAEKFQLGLGADSDAPDTKGANVHMSTEVTLPALGESVTEGTISRWLKAVGETVEVDEPLLEVSTDKVDTEIPSPVAGTLLEIRFNEDDVAEVGAIQIGRAHV